MLHCKTWYRAPLGEFIMQTVKQIVHDIADHLPEQATFDDAIYVCQKLARSLQAAEEGKITCALAT